MRLQNPIVVTATLLVAALTSAGQTKDLAGSKDPALFTRMPGFVITDYRESQFDAHDFTPDVIRVVKEAKAEIYVDRMGTTDAPAGWQSAIDAGADGIQTDRPAELVQYLREKGYRKP